MSRARQNLRKRMNALHRQLEREVCGPRKKIRLQEEWARLAERRQPER